MWLRLVARTLLLTLVMVQLSAPDGLPQTPGASGPSTATTLWTDREWAQARRFSPLPPLPADPTNALADNLQAAHLGHRLFFDPRLSPRGVACATCHQPERGFTDGLAVANTLAPLQRNTMTILNVQYYGAAFRQLGPLPETWDTLWPTLPSTGQPGEPAFDMLPPAHQEAVNRV